jgi:rubrerythrin
MNFNNTVLAIELENLQRREIEMHRLYSELLKEVKNERVKSDIKFIRDQELGHIEMVTTIISTLQEYVNKG